MIVLNEATVTKEIFAKYVAIQREGKYNMVMDAKEVMTLMGVTEDIYKSILQNYERYSKKFNMGM